MKDGWIVKKLGEVCKFSQGVQIPLEEQYTTCEKGMIRFLRIIDFTQKGETPRYIYNVDDKYILHDKEIAIVRYGTPGFVCYGKIGAIANNLFKILPKENLFDFAFLKYWLSSEAFQGVIKGSKYGVALQAIKFSTICEISVPIPPLSEQSRIVEELDQLSNIIEKKREQLSELDNLAQSIFYDMFGDPVVNEKGWEMKKLGEVCIHKRQIERANKFFSSIDTIQYIDISSIDNKSNTICRTNIIQFVDAPSRAQQRIVNKDVLISLVRPNLKNVALVNYTCDNLVASTGFCVLRTTDMVNPYYILFSVLSEGFTEYLMERISGANYPAVREEDIKEYNLCIPPLSLQQLFAQKIEAIESEKALIKQSIAETEDLFNSRMDFYFG